MGEFLDRLKGRLKKLEGRLTGDKVRTAQGHAEETMGEVKGAADDLGKRAKRVAREVKQDLDKP